MDLIVITKGGDLQEGVRIDKHPRTRLSDYSWRAELRSTVGAVPVQSTLTTGNGRIIIADDLAGDLTLVWGHDETATFTAGSYVLDLRAENSTTGLIEFSDIIAVTVREPVTQAA